MIASTPPGASRTDLPIVEVADLAGAFGSRKAVANGIRDPGTRVDDSLRRMSMLERADAPVRLLSLGMQQRVSIARATVHSPQVVLADEPYSGLDESGARSG